MMHCLVTDLCLLLRWVQLLQLPCSGDGDLVCLRLLGQPFGLQRTQGRLVRGACAILQAKQDIHERQMKLAAGWGKCCLPINSTPRLHMQSAAARQA